MKKVLVISASDSEIETMKEATAVLDEFEVENELTISSAHRSPQRTTKLVSDFAAQGGKVIICGAGLAAHLAGVIASFTTLPVIGVPVKTKTLDGLDSLLSTSQMPPGIPVATVGINASKNAGLLAVQILALSDKNLEKKLIAYKNKMSNEVKKKGEKLSKIGYKKYLGSPVGLRPREK